MSIELVSVKCPECGANLSVENNRDVAFCSYCGSRILIHNDKEFVYRHVDEARLKEAEAYENVELAEIELEREWQANRKKSINRWMKLWVALLVIGAVLFGLGALLNKTDDFEAVFESPLGIAGILSFAFGEIVLFYGGIGYFISLLSHNRIRRKRLSRK